MRLIMILVVIAAALAAVWFVVPGGKDWMQGMMGKSEEAVEDAGDAVEEAADDTAEAIEEAGDDMEEAADDATDDDPDTPE